MDATWRNMARTLERENRKADAARKRAQAADAALAAQLNRESMRFGRTIPADPFLLDILSQIDVVNPGEPRPGASERSTVRVLAEAFGVVSPEQNGVLYPLGSRDDVNPFHRQHRPGSNAPMGTWPHREAS